MIPAPYRPTDRLCDATNFRRSGRSGLELPAISLGLWQHFGGVDVVETGRAARSTAA